MVKKNEPNRTTEDDVGFLSKLVTKLHTLKAEAILANIEQGEDASFAVPTRDVAAMGKWVLDNGVIALPSAENAESELSQTLQRIKEKSNVLNFEEEMKERGMG